MNATYRSIWLLAVVSALSRIFRTSFRGLATSARIVRMTTLAPIRLTELWTVSCSPGSLQVWLCYGLLQFGWCLLYRVLKFFVQRLSHVYVLLQIVDFCVFATRQCRWCRCVCPLLSSVCSSGQILLSWYLMNGLSNLDETYREYSFTPTDDLITFCRSRSQQAV